MSPPHFEPLPDARFKDFFARCATLRRHDEVYRLWHAQTTGRHRPAEYNRRCKAIIHAADVSDATLRNALHPDIRRQKHVGAKLRQRLLLMARILELPVGPLGLPPAERDGSIALLTDLDVLSMRFHFELMRSLVYEATTQALELAVHACPRGDIAEVIERLQVRHVPDAYILVRLTPTKAALEVLRQTSTPVVLIHADVLKYGPPVLAHVVPDQTDVPAGIEKWLEALKKARKVASPEVILIGVPDEEPVRHDWLPLEAGMHSIRNQRKKLILAALTKYGARPTLVEVKDYSARRALAPFLDHRLADGFVCLSDSLAVAMKHHFIIAGQPWERRILGFDNTTLAQDEGISSFDQSRIETAKLAIDALMRHFNPTGPVDASAAAELLKVKVSLKLRPEVPALS